MAVLIKNSVNETKGVANGVWDSTNFFTVKFGEDNNGLVKAIYTLTSTTILQMETHHKTCGHINVSGSITRQVI